MAQERRRFCLDVKLDVDFGWIRFVSTRPLLPRRNAPQTRPSTDAAVQELRRVVQKDKDTFKLIEAGGEVSDDVFLARWLRAKKHDLDAAVVALHKHSRWRSTFVPKGRIHDREILGEIRAKKVFLQGCDTQGFALLIVMARRHDMKMRDFKQTEKLIVYTLDTASALADMGEGQRICCLFDLSGLTLRNLDVKVLTTIFEILQKHYPERLGMIWMVNAPFIFWAAWRVVSPLLEECSRRKIKFVSCHGQSCSSFLRDTIPMDVLPRCYGGDAELIPIESAALQIFQHGISHPKELKSIVAIDWGNGERETWRTWLRRHRKLMRVVNWANASARALAQNKLSRYLWGKVRRSVWRSREKIHIHLPMGEVPRQKTLTECLNAQGRHPPWVIWIVVLFLLDVFLVLIGKMREALMEVVWPD